MYHKGDRVQFLYGFSHDGVFVPAGWIGTVERDGPPPKGESFQFISVVAKRMSWLCKLDEIRPAPKSTSHIEVFERRADGWPLCPHCGEDELWSPLTWDGDEKPPLQDFVNAGLSCYYCGWKQGENHGK